jgi:hypothetical protein
MVATERPGTAAAGREYAKQYGLEALENQREIPRRCDPNGPDAPRQCSHRCLSSPISNRHRWIRSICPSSPQPSPPPGPIGGDGGTRRGELELNSGASHGSARRPPSPSQVKHYGRIMNSHSVPQHRMDDSTWFGEPAKNAERVPASRIQSRTQCGGDSARSGHVGERRDWPYRFGRRRWRSCHRVVVAAWRRRVTL